MNEKSPLKLHAYSSPPDNWNVLENICNGNIYHSSVWAETCVTENSRPVYFVWEKPNHDIVAIAIGIRRWSKAPLIGRHLNKLVFESSPALVEERKERAGQVLRKIHEYAKSSGYMELEVRSYMSEYAVKNIAELGFQTQPRLEFVINLDQSDDELLKKFSTHHRRKLRKAQKHGLMLKEASTLEAMREFRKLQVASRDRRLKRGENIGVLEDSHYEKLGEKYFKRNLGKVFLAIQGNTPVSGAFVTVYNGKALYVFGGSSDEGFKKDAPAFLFWHIISRCKEEGCKIFNLGGVPLEAKTKGHPSHGLYRFKAGYGGDQKVQCSAKAANLRPVLCGIEMSLKKVKNKLNSIEN